MNIHLHTYMKYLFLVFRLICNTPCIVLAIKVMTCNMVPIHDSLQSVGKADIIKYSVNKYVT